MSHELYIFFREVFTANILLIFNSQQNIKLLIDAKVVEFDLSRVIRDWSTLEPKVNFLKFHVHSFCLLFVCKNIIEITSL